MSYGNYSLQKSGSDLFGIKFEKRARKNGLIIVSMLCFFILLSFLFWQRCAEKLWVRSTRLHESVTRSKYLDSTVAQLPVGYALLFVDADKQYGYIYFDKIERDRVSYVFIINKMGSQKEQKGEFYVGSCFPWRRRTMCERAVFDGHEEFPHFTWIPLNGFGFRKSKILRVGMIPLAEIQETRFETNVVEWVQTGDH